MSMTPADLTNLERLLEKATKGPLKAVKGADPYSDDPERWAIWRTDEEAPLSPDYLVAIIENGSPGDTMATEGHTAQLFAALHAAAPDLIKCARALQEIANHNHSACAEMDSLTERDCLRMIVESAKEALSAGQTGVKDV